MYYIYGELFIIENLIINFIILKLTSKLLHRKMTLFRCVLISVISSIYSLMQFSFPILTWYPLKILLSVLIVGSGFFPIKLREFIKAMIIFYTTSAIFGGCVFILIFMFNQESDMTLEVHGVKFYFVILGIFLGFQVVMKLKDYMIENKLNEENLMVVNLSIDSQISRINGFRDTGCSLADPMSGKPVLLVTYDSIKSILPNEIKLYLQSYDNTYDTNIHNHLSDNKYLKRIHFIPYHSVQNNSQYLFCYMVDYIEFSTENNKLKLDKVYVGICMNSISHNNEFQALINPKLLFI